VLLLSPDLGISTHDKWSDDGFAGAR
jgi:hypothetical protein